MRSQSQTELQVGPLSGPPANALPGVYQMRLVLSDVADVSWSGVGSSGNGFVFDSGTFQIDEPPLDGQCQVYPSRGEAPTTFFYLTSLNWKDDDLPL